jgi:hypothetical protein
MAPTEHWNVEITDEYLNWFRMLDAGLQDALRTDIEILEKLGPSLGRPYVDSIKGSKHSNMKELRTMHARRHIRTFFAFDPRRTAILLIGGDKTGNKSFYDRMIAVADRLFDHYLKEIKKEGFTP